MGKAIYNSKYTDRKVTVAQYLTDFMVERLAEKEKSTLPYKYWNDKKWSGVFKWQLTAANRLLEEVDIIPLMAFLRSVKGRKIYSLGMKKVILEGAKNFVVISTNIISSESTDKNGDIYSEDIVVDTVVEKTIKNKSLWEELNGTT